MQRQVAAEFEAEGFGLRWHWIDIEDEAELLGEVDVETFPTVVIVDADGRLRFAGALQPQPEVLRRLLRACIEADGPAALGTFEPAMQAFAARLRGRVGP